MNKMIQSKNALIKMYEEKGLIDFEKNIEYRFKDKTFLIKALSHMSKKGSSLTSKTENKKLGLIGDKLIDLVNYIDRYDIEITQGLIDDSRQSKTKNEDFKQCLDRLGLEKYLFLDPGTSIDTAKNGKNVTSDTIEAIVGAIFLDSNKNFETVSHIIKKKILK